MNAKTYTPELETAIAEIKALPSYRDIKDRASAVDITEKPEEKSWEEMAPEIAIAEFQTAGKPIYQESEAPEQVPDRQKVEPIKPTGSAEFYRVNSIPFCPACQEKFLTGSDGQPMCPVQKPDCPRHVK